MCHNAGASSCACMDHRLNSVHLGRGYMGNKLQTFTQHLLRASPAVCLAPLSTDPAAAFESSVQRRGKTKGIEMKSNLLPICSIDQPVQIRPAAGARDAQVSSALQELPAWRGMPADKVINTCRMAGSK